MPLIDEAVITAAQGYVFRAPVGTAAPTPADVDALVDPEVFGSQVSTFTVTGTPTGGSWTVKCASGDTPVTVPFNPTKAQFQDALESLQSVGVGNTVVTGTALSSGFAVSFVGPLQGKTITITIVDAGLTGGTTPHVTSSVTTATNGWINIGHTGRKKLPEFGFEGGKLEVKGSWQKLRLREIQTGDPVVDSVKIELEQFDPVALELYYGEDSADTPGVFGVAGDFIPIECALLIVIMDGDIRIGFYAPRASVSRDASITLTEDDFGSLPIKASFLNLGSRRLFDWISEALLS